MMAFYFLSIYLSYHAIIFIIEKNLCRPFISYNIIIISSILEVCMLLCLDVASNISEKPPLINV